MPDLDDDLIATVDGIEKAAPTIDNLREIVTTRSYKVFKWGKKECIVDLFTASAMVKVYDALTKPESRTLFEERIADSPMSFLKISEFCFKQMR